MLCLFAMLLVMSGCGANESFSLEDALGKNTEVISSDVSTLETSPQQQKTERIIVYVCGHVQVPGVYELEAGSRIVSAIEAAGGFAIDAAKEAINLAEPLKDGMQINVPSLDDISVMQAEYELQQKGLVNINKATVEELCMLPGIGQTKAENIIRHRESTGLFEKPEDIQQVTGIGESLYLQIKDKIYIE